MMILGNFRVVLVLLLVMIMIMIMIMIGGSLVRLSSPFEAQHDAHGNQADHNQNADSQNERGNVRCIAGRVAMSDPGWRRLYIRVVVPAHAGPVIIIRRIVRILW